MTTCGAVGALMVGGRVVGQVKCDLPAGHESSVYGVGESQRVGAPHRSVLTWTPEAEPDLDLFDPDEVFDTVVPLTPPECSTCGSEHGLLDPCRLGDA